MVIMVACIFLSGCGKNYKNSDEYIQYLGKAYLDVPTEFAESPDTLSDESGIIDLSSDEVVNFEGLNGTVDLRYYRGEDFANFLGKRPNIITNIVWTPDEISVKTLEYLKSKLEKTHGNYDEFLEYLKRDNDNQTGDRYYFSWYDTGKEGMNIEMAYTVNPNDTSDIHGIIVFLSN